MYKLNTLCSSNIKNFHLEMIPDKKAHRCNFYLVENMQNTSTKDNCLRNISYSVSLKTKKEEIASVLRLTHLDLKNNSNSHLLYQLIPSRSFLYKYLSHNDTLTIHFEFNVVVQIYNSSITVSGHATTKNTDIFNDDTDKEILMVRKEKSDLSVTFIVDNKRLEANKSLLCSKSKVFEAMFNNGLIESVKNEVIITDINYDILKTLLDFVRTGDVFTLGTKKNALYELFIAADKYDIQNLKLKCENDLIINTTVSNVVEHLKMACLYNGEMLEKYAKSFINLYLKDIENTPEFITLIEMYPELLTQIKEMPIVLTKL